MTLHIDLFWLVNAVPLICVLGLLWWNYRRLRPPDGPLPFVAGGVAVLAHLVMFLLYLVIHLSILAAYLSA